MSIPELLAYNAELSVLRQQIRDEQLRVNAAYSDRVRTHEIAQAVGVGVVEGKANGNA